MQTPLRDIEIISGEGQGCYPNSGELNGQTLENEMEAGLLSTYIYIYVHTVNLMYIDSGISQAGGPIDPRDMKPQSVP